MDGIQTVRYQTELGEGVLYWRGKELVAHALPGSREAAGSAHETRARGRAGPRGRYTQLLESYFAGETVSFPLEAVPLDELFPTPFQLSVVRTLAEVPYGATTSYGELAAGAGYPQAHRAVGNLMAANPLPLIIPCHRVLRSDGSLGHFSAGDHWKVRLLELEGQGQ